MRPLIDLKIGIDPALFYAKRPEASAGSNMREEFVMMKFAETYFKIRSAKRNVYLKRMKKKR